MNSDQRAMLFGLFKQAMEKRGIIGKQASDAERAKLTESLFGEPYSWSGFGEYHVDRMKRLLMIIVDGADLDSALDLVKYEEHDQSAAAHVPVVTPGKRQFKLRGGPRQHASRYERIPAADNPGERSRLIWFITRLFDDPYVEKFARDIDRTSEWRALPIPQLTALRDVLFNRLSTWISSAKKEPRAEHLIGVDLASSNPRSPSGIASNKEIVRRLLHCGQPVQMLSRKELAAHRSKTLAPNLPL